VLLGIFVGILMLLGIAFAVEILSQPRPVVEQRPAVSENAEQSERDALWDPDRMGRMLQRELDKVEEAR